MPVPVVVRYMRRLLGSALVLPALALGLTTTAPAHADAGLLSTVTQNVLPGLANATLLAPYTTSTLDLIVSLPRPDPAGERALIAAEHTPGNAQYRHFLTPDQFAARFGVPAAQQSAVRDFFTSGGATVDRVSAAGDVFTVSGTTATFAKLFRTSFNRY